MLRQFNIMIIGCSLALGMQTVVAADKPVSPDKHATVAKHKASKQTVAHKLKAADLSAAQIIDKNAQARGGLKAWRAVKSMQMSGIMDAGYIKPKKNLDPAASQLNRSLTRTGRIQAAIARSKEEQDPGKLVQVPFRMDLERPGKQRLEVKYDDSTSVQVYDGKQGWKVRPFMGKHEVESYTAQELKLAQLQTELDGALIDYQAKGYKVNVDGLEPVNGKNAYRLTVTMAEGMARHVWVDAKSFLEVQIDETRQLGGKPRAVITAMNKYKTVNGVKIPFELVTYVEGTKTTPPAKIQIEKVTLNPKLAADTFNKPKA